MSVKQDIKAEEAGLDLRVGQNIRAIRRSQGKMMDDIAGKLGVTHQQVHKYECGKNRLSVGKLVIIARTLGVSVTRLIGEG